MANQNEKEPEKHVHVPVAEGKVVEKSKFQKALGIFLEEDATDIKANVNNYIEERAKSFGKEIKRKAKEFILDNINGAAEIMLFGKGRRSGNGDSSTYKSGTYNGQNVVYTSYYPSDGSSNGYTAKIQDNREAGTRLKLITLPSYGKAEDVKGELLSLSKKYPNVSVGDYYQLCGIATAKEDFNFGWKKLFEEPIEIVYSAKASGYQLVLPRPISLI